MPVTITNRTAPPARGAPGNIDSLFVPAGIETSGLPLDRAVRVRSLGDYIAAGATRAMDTVTYDGLDAFFREGGHQAYVARYTESGTIDSALDLFTEELGGGHVVSWSETPDATLFGKLQDYAASTRRYAYLDVAVEDDTMTELSAAAVAPAQNADYGAQFGPWVTIPAPDGVIGGTARSVPGSAVAAALTARADDLGNPNRAPAGRDFPLQYATGLVGPSISDADAETLRVAGLNPFREKFGVLVLDGFQTSIEKTPDSPFWQANCGRARMWLQWQALNAGLNYEYKPLDGRGRLASKLKADLDVIGKQLWEVDGLYGETPEEAYANTVGASVNNESTVAQGELHAVMEARFSLHAKTVIIDLVSVPVTGRVSTPA